MRHDTSQSEAHRYPDERRAATARGGRVTALCALALIPLFAYLDTVVFTAHAAQFVQWRAASFVVVLAAFALLRTPLGRHVPLLFSVLTPIAIGLNIDLVTVVAGREANPYYAGLIVLLLGASLLLPWPPVAALVVSTVLVGGYAAALLATGPIADVPLFMSNLFIVGAAAVLVVVAAAVSERLRRREFQSRKTLDAHARRQEAIARLGQLALGGTRPHELMDRTAALIPEMLGFELAAVLELGADEKGLLLRSGVGWQGGLVGWARVALESRSQARYVLEHGPICTDDLARDTRFPPMPLLQQHRALSGVCVPIAGRDRPVGILVAFTAERHTCIPREVEALEALAAVLTTAILRTEAADALADDAHESAVLAEIGRELISSLETPVLLERLCQRTAEALGVDHSITWLLDPGARVYRPISSHGIPPEKWEALRALRLPVGALSSLVASLTRNDVVELTPSSHQHPLATRVLDLVGSARSLLLPLRRGGEIIGVQTIGSRARPEPYSAKQARLGRAIAQLASMALSNARLVEELEHTSHRKSEFVSTMSHELRTPLNVIVGYLDILGEQIADTADRSLITGARTASLELLEMIDATLNLQRIGAGQDVPIIADVSIPELWAELRADFAAMPRKTAAGLRWEPPADVPLRTDRRKLKIVVKNLVGNALKFTPAGEVVVRCAVDGDRCVFTVSDTGVGIPPDHLPHIFEMFRQVDSSDKRSYAGAGLGLYIVKSFLTQLEGEVHVESAVGHGSTFTVRIPRDRVVTRAPEPGVDGNGASPGATDAASSDAPDRAAELAGAADDLARVTATTAATRDVVVIATPPPAPRRRRIVFADDLELSRRIFRHFISREMPDVECFEAADGVQALALVEAHKPDLVILDLRMPEMDGWEAARRIRALEHGRDVPIIALSVTASPGTEAYAIHAGCTEFVAKPVSDYTALAARICHWIGPTEAGAAAYEPGGEAERCALCGQMLPIAYLHTADAPR